MAPLSSFISKPSWKARTVDIRSRFALRKADQGQQDFGSTTTPRPSSSTIDSPVLSIDQTPSMDFDGGPNPSEYGHQRTPSSAGELPPLPTTSSRLPPIQLSLELGAPTETFSDWVESTFRHAESVADLNLSPTSTHPSFDSRSLNGPSREVGDHSAYPAVELKQVEGLRVHEASHGRSLPIPITSVASPLSTVKLGHRLSTPLSSSVSGTTLARALLANTYSLSPADRASGQTDIAPDSAVLPHDSFYGYGQMDEAFTPPPLPSDAVPMYQPPSYSRPPTLWREASSASLASQSQQLPAAPSTTSLRPQHSNGAPNPAAWRDSPHSSVVSLVRDEEEGDATLASPPLVSARSAVSDAPSSGRQLDEMLNYYTAPAAIPEAGFVPPTLPPAFAALSEDTLSPLLPPTPRRFDHHRTSTSRTPSLLGPRVRGDSLRQGGSRLSSRQGASPALDQPTTPPPLQTKFATLTSPSTHPSTVISESQSVLPADHDLSTRSGTPEMTQQRSASPGPLAIPPRPLGTRPQPLDFHLPGPARGRNESQTSLVQQALLNRTIAPLSLSARKTGDTASTAGSAPSSRSISPARAPSHRHSALSDRSIESALEGSNGRPEDQFSYVGLAHAQTGVADGVSVAVTPPSAINATSDGRFDLDTMAGVMNIADTNQRLSVSDGGSMYTTSSARSVKSGRMKSLPPVPRMEESEAGSESTELTDSPEASPALLPPPAQVQPTLPSKNEDDSDDEDMVTGTQDDVERQLQMGYPSGPPVYSSAPTSATRIGFARTRTRPPTTIKTDHRWSIIDREQPTRSSTLENPHSGASTRSLVGLGSAGSSAVSPRPPGSTDRTGALAPLMESTIPESSLLEPTVPIPEPLSPTESEPTKEDEPQPVARTAGSIPSMGAPPPYYAVVSDTMMHMSHPSAPQPAPHAVTLDRSPTYRAQAPTRESMLTGPRGPRTRPQLGPGGPRRPSAGFIHERSESESSITGGPSSRRMGSTIATQVLAPLQGHTRSHSQTDIQSQLSQGRPGPPAHSTMTTRATPLLVPKFQVPLPRWRGYTFDAAKWTFTSDQLQTIVSQAIRKSAEASAVRLLPQDVIDNEIPKEIGRLEAQRTDLKTRYKVLVRRRTTLFDILYQHLGGQAQDSTAASRLLEDVGEMALTLDRLTEELHSLDEQISALYLLQTTHNGSALAMALRKLNTSFIKKIAENQMLRHQVSALEAERDEAWQHAESLAREYDEVVADGPPATLALPGKSGAADWTVPTTKPAPPSAMRPMSGQSHRVSATRKGSIRRSKAGLRISNGFQSSNRASVSSARLVSARTPLSRDSLLQPVPRLPKLYVKTGGNSPSGTRASTLFSASHRSQEDEAKALAQAESDVYTMLGIIPPNTPLRRTRSTNSVRRSLPSHSQVNSPLSPGPSSPTRLARRSSLPCVSDLAGVYNAMTADRQAVLATLDLLSRTE